MSSVEKISIGLPPDMIATLKSAVESGEYANTSEVICEPLRAWKFKRKIETLELDELCCLVQEGIESGPSVDGELLLAKLREKYAAMGSKTDSYSAFCLPRGPH